MPINTLDPDYVEGLEKAKSFGDAESLENAYAAQHHRRMEAERRVAELTAQCHHLKAELEGSQGALEDSQGQVQALHAGMSGLQGMVEDVITEEAKDEMQRLHSRAVDMALGCAAMGEMIREAFRPELLPEEDPEEVFGAPPS